MRDATSNIDAKVTVNTSASGTLLMKEKSRLADINFEGNLKKKTSTPGRKEERSTRAVKFAISNFKTM